MAKNDAVNLNPSLAAEAQAFDERATQRLSNGFLPDLRCQTRNEYFYKSFWRDGVFTDLYVGQMARQYVEYIKSLQIKNPHLLQNAPQSLRNCATMNADTRIGEKDSQNNGNTTTSDTAPASTKEAGAKKPHRGYRTNTTSKNTNTPQAV